MSGSVNDQGITASLDGAVSTNALSDTVHALVRNGATLTSAGDLQVSADGRSAVTVTVTAATISASAAVSSTFGLTLQAAVATVNVSDDVQALGHRLDGQCRRRR